MELRSSIDGENNVVFSFGDKIDLEFSIRYKSRMKDVIRSDTYKNVIVDLSETNYIDSSVIGMFLLLKRTANEQGVDFILRGVNDDIKGLLIMGQFDKIFTIL